MGGVFLTTALLVAALAVHASAEADGGAYNQVFSALEAQKGALRLDAADTSGADFFGGPKLGESTSDGYPSEKEEMIICSKVTGWEYTGTMQAGSSGKCLDGKDKASEGDCASSQKWTYSAKTGLLTSGGKCMDKDLKIGSCSGAKSQNWDYTPTEGPEMKKLTTSLFKNSKSSNVIGELKSQDGGECLTNTAGSMTLVKCDKTAKDQRWELDSGSSTYAMLPITGPNPKNAVKKAKGGGKGGGKMEELGEETGERSGMVVCLKTNKWKYEGTMKIQTGKCLSAKGKEATAGDCGDKPKWNFSAASGQVKHVSSGKCLRSEQKSAKVEVVDCSSDDILQKWEYTASSGPELDKPNFTDSKEMDVLGELKHVKSSKCLSGSDDAMSMTACDMASKGQQFWLKSGSDTSAMIPLTGPAPKPKRELGEADDGVVSLDSSDEQAEWFGPRINAY